MKRRIPEDSCLTSQRSNEELAHADLLAECIVQLGGMPEFNPERLSALSHANTQHATRWKR